jgi:hypothetical protein
MNRRAYELYGVERDEDLRLVKVPLGYSTELVGRAGRPRPEAAVEVLPASGRFSEWLVDHRRAGAHDDMRFLVVSDRDVEYYNPLEGRDSGLLARLAYLDFSAEEAVLAFVRSYGLPSTAHVYPSLRYWSDGEWAEGVTVGALGDVVDFVPKDYRHKGRHFDRGVFIGWWALEREAAQVRTILELLKAARQGDADAAMHLIGPLGDLRDLPYRGTRVGRHLYERYGPCSFPPGSNAKPCSLERECPKPDKRSGWYLSYPIPFFAFGPCAQRLPVLPEEYLIVARHAIALSMSDSPHLTSGVNVEPLIDANLRSAALGEFREGFFLRLLPEDAEQPGSMKEVPSYYQPMLLELVEGSRPRSPAAHMERQPLFEFHRSVRGVLGAAWCQLLDLAVHFSELKRCKHCGALFGAAHGGQDYCPAAKPGQRSACQQAAKKARQRAARKATEPRRPRRPLHAASP